jgi:hypothetical protein
MAGVRFYRPLALILLLATGAARSENQPNPPGFYARPVLVVDPGMHTAAIAAASADHDGRWAVTGSLDKTVRIWSIADGNLERTIRLPAGPEEVGHALAVAISPDGALIAVSGNTTPSGEAQQIYLFDRPTGALVGRIQGLPNNVDALAFSTDGTRLAAGLATRGVFVYARERAWDEVARDEEYGGAVYGVDFAPDGRLATTSLDGVVRLCARDAVGPVRPVATVELRSPLYRIAFSSSDGAHLAVGYAATPRSIYLTGVPSLACRLPTCLALGKFMLFWRSHGRTTGRNCWPVASIPMSAVRCLHGATAARDLDDCSSRPIALYRT